MARFRLNGSLTTPPCSENVSLDHFKAPIQAVESTNCRNRRNGRENNRPTQPLNQRDVEVEQ